MNFQLDTSIPMSYKFGPGPLEQMQSVMTLADLMDKRKMNKIAIEETERQNKIREAQRVEYEESLKKWEKPLPPITAPDTAEMYQQAIKPIEAIPAKEIGPSGVEVGASNAIMDKWQGLTPEQRITAESAGVQYQGPVGEAGPMQPSITVPTQEEFQARPDIAPLVEQRVAQETAAQPESRIPQEFNFLNPGQYDRFLRLSSKSPELGWKFIENVMDYQKTQSIIEKNLRVPPSKETASGEPFAEGSPEYAIAERVAEGTLPITLALKMYSGFGSKTGKRENLVTTVYKINPEWTPLPGEEVFVAGIAATRSAAGAAAKLPIQNETTLRRSLKQALQGNNPIALQEKKIGIARHALQLVYSSRQKDGTYKMNRSMHGELITTIANLLGAGATATDTQRDELIQRSLTGDALQAYQYIRSRPEGTIPKSIVVMLKHIIDRQGIESEKQRDEGISNIKRASGQLTPAAQARIDSEQYGLKFGDWVEENDPDVVAPVEELPEPEPEIRPPSIKSKEDEQAIKWAKANRSDPRAVKILKLNGVK